MHVRVRPPLLSLALALGLPWAVAFAQPTFDIALGETRTGTIGTFETSHVYLLDVATGLDGLTVEVDGGDRDADLAVYLGDVELFRDITGTTRPTFVAAAPQAGRYRIEVLNPWFQQLPYTIRVSRGAAGAVDAPSRPIAPTADTIEIGGTRTGVIPAEEIYREYLLEVPAGLAGFAVRLTAGGADADMAVYLGSEELFDDISSDPNPVFSLASPRAGTYRIVVKNLLAQPLDYTLSVSAEGAAPPPSAPPSPAGLRSGAGVVAPGAPITVAWTGAPGNVRDWVGLYRVDAEDRGYLGWQYTGGAPAGQLTFTAPGEPGRYDFRLFENDGYTRLAVSGAFEVVAPAPTPPVTPAPPAPVAGRGWVQTFAAGSTEGWTGENASLSNPGTGGPDGGGYLYATTPGEGRVGYFVAPARLLGDWSSFTTLRLALQTGPRHDGDTFGPFEPGGVGDVFLANGAMTAAYAFPAMPTRAWTTFDVPLSDAAAWRLGGGARSLPDVLANVTSLKVRAEYVVGDADAGLASVETLTGAAPAGPAIALACATQARGDTLGALAVGTSASVSCPAGCRDELAVWGSDVYTDDSSVCRAAIHAGVIDAERGGAFIVTIREGQPGYEASTRHGVTTRPWGGWGRSFSVSAGASGGVAGPDDAIAGTWQLDANGFRGTLTFVRQGDAWLGTYSLGRDEPLEAVGFDGATVRFVRPLGANTQEYLGSFSDDGATQRLAGTFYQGGERTPYPWSAERPRPAGPPVAAPAASESVAVTSDQAATLTTTQGVVVAVPAGAVPVTEAGGVGTMVFSAEPSALTPAPPGGAAAVGPVVQLGPAGLTFEQPVTLTFPIPDGVDPATVVGLTTLDPADGAWVVVPGVVDPVARTVTVWTDHFSPWAVAIRPAGRPVDGGVVRIANAMARGGSTVYPCGGGDPGCRAGLPTSHGYGVCMVSWVLDDPGQRFWGERDGLSRVAAALDGQTIEWWLPDGSYVFEPFFHMSQINPSPLYVPRHQMFVQPAISLTLRGGQVIAFGDDYPRGYVEGWTHCHGGTGAGSTRGPITAVGTGDVQVTLTWQANVDLDLYVTDPNGDTVYFGNDRVASGGELDRDNLCGNFEWGRPENVYWPAGGAPAGTYAVKVDYWGSCGDASPAVAWTVRTIVGGQVQTFTGTIGSYEEVAVTTFTVR